MELTQIKYFLAVAKNLNFTSAAEACAVSQPALSKAIQKLESTLGADLFDRSSQQIKLTEFGRTMLIHFERIDDSRRMARDAAKSATTASTTHIDVGIMCTIGPDRFSRFFDTFRTKYPNIEITLHDVVGARLPEILLSGALSCVFCARTAEHDARFQAVDLFNEQMAVAFAPDHKFASYDSVTLSQIANEPYLDRLHCEFRDDFLKFTKASGLTLNVVLRSEREDWILELVGCGMGVSVMPISMIDPNKMNYRPISDMKKLRQLELVLSNDEAIASELAHFRDEAQNFDWG